MRVPGFQNITYWTPQGVGPEGEVYNTPVTVQGRWEERSEEYMTPSGEEKVSRAIVYLDLYLPIDTYLYEGTSAVADPREVDGAQQVQQCVKIPNLRNLNVEYRSLL